MAKEAILQVRMDSELKEQAMPFTIHLASHNPDRVLGIANGKYIIPDNIDECNDEISAMFEVAES